MRAVITLGLLSLLGCTPEQPPNWPQGGAALTIAPARWDRPGEDTVELRADGQVLEDGDLVFVIDRAGRIVDSDYDPVAILLPDGRLFGLRQRLLGQVGVTNAAPPWAAHAWLAVTPDGNATHFDSDGERASLGRWHGCNGPALRACTLVTHMFILRHHRAESQSGVSVGVGVGIGF